MIQASDFINPAKEFGFNTWSGVPCSFLTPFINSVIDDPQMSYISSANEGDAVAAATGAALAGKRAVAMMQNSGLGNAVSPLSSLNWVFRIPILLIITLRGEPGLPDEPQHELMGQITGKILDELQIPWVFFPRSADEVEGVLTVAKWQMDRSGLPYALVMRKGSVGKSELKSRWQPAVKPASFSDDQFCKSEPELSRQQALTAVVEQTPVDQSVVIGSTGYTGRELFAVADRPNQLYMVGSMGCASSLGLGLSLALPDQRVLVVDGDGAALMRMGNLATIGAYGGEDFRHLLLDNGVHESTGGQSTVSPSVSFAAVARACGYRQAAETTTRAGLDTFLKGGAGPSLLQMKIKRGVPADLPRPDIGPREVKQRLMLHLGVDAPWAGV
ncbi:MAG: phosphonopyruvate decarboxylase [Xanthomonadales bacterium]|nr:phosphonopyruvate decarboxylase [Gammaproteobacteria bacterium]NNK51000.1 phosphonopyruvate decarboxylase [Xanthomonadales bacterium]